MYMQGGAHGRHDPGQDTLHAILARLARTPNAGVLALFVHVAKAVLWSKD